MSPDSYNEKGKIVVSQGYFDRRYLGEYYTEEKMAGMNIICVDREDISMAWEILESEGYQIRDVEQTASMGYLIDGGLSLGRDGHFWGHYGNPSIEIFHSTENGLEEMARRLKLPLPLKN